MRFTRPSRSTDLVSDRETGVSVDAVHAFFDRVENLLPRYVSRTPSMLIAFLVSVTLLYIFRTPILEDREANKDEIDPVKRYRWILWAGILFVVIGFVRDAVQQTVHRTMNLRVNSQHFANTFWLREYMTAQSPSLLKL
jgi:hypothetical protein